MKNSKNCIHQEIKAYLDKQKVENLEQASTEADGYALSHKVSFTKQWNSNNDSLLGRPDNSHITLRTKSISSEQVKITDKNNETTKSSPMCNYFKRKGHFKSDCKSSQRK